MIPIKGEKMESTDSVNRESPEVSVVMPCLNEEETIGVCVEKVLKAFNDFNIKGEIIVSDNGSTDRSIEIASSFGERVRVVHQPRKGYGSAYLKGLDNARGRFIVIGDSDDSYDFYELQRLLKPLKEEGFDMVIGSRFKGQILPGAMPWANRYIGNPILSGMLRILFRTNISDSHSGFRSFTKEAYEKMALRTTGMEFASEIIVSAVRNNLKIKEIPIRYHPRKGVSKLNPLRDAWRHVRFMLLYSPDYIFLIPGGLIFAIGFAGLMFFFEGPVRIFGHIYEFHAMIFSSMLVLLGFQILNFGFCAKTYALVEGFERKRGAFARLYKFFTLERGILFGAALVGAGAVMSLSIVQKWITFGSFSQEGRELFAFTLVLIGAQTVFSSFLISLLGLKEKERKR